MSGRPVVAIFIQDSSLAAEAGRFIANDGAEVKIINRCDDLYQLANFNRLDVLVIQQETKSFLSGLEMISRLFEDLLRPAIVFIPDLRGESIPQAQQLGVEVVLKPCLAAADIAAGVSRSLSKSEHPAIYVSAAARRIVQRCDNIPPLPQVILQLAQHAQRDDVSPIDVASQISTDPRLTADLLRIINSSAMGFSRRIVKVFDAVTLLGVKRTASLLLSSRVLESHAAFTQTIPDGDRLWFNRRSILTAASASIFAERFAGLSADTSYILGLLQDLGILVMMKVYGLNYIQLIRRFRKVGQFRLEAIEKQDFGVTHADVSTALLVKWGFPQSVTAAIAQHHENSSTVNVPESRFCPVLEIGEAVANLMDGHVAHRLPQFTRSVAKLGDIDPLGVKQAIADAVAHAAKQARIFAIPVPADGALETMVMGVSHYDGQITELPDDVSDRPMEGNLSKPPVDDTASENGMTESEERPQQRTEIKADEVTTPKRVVLFEDDKRMTSLIRRMLENKGLAVQECAGIDSSSFEQPADVIVCDGRIGSVDGVSLISQLRHHGNRVPIILLSEDRTREGVRRGILAGASDYLVKPVDLRYLSQRVDFWLHSAP